jgi:drug/metabolite transporter (DMT)-like permease
MGTISLQTALLSWVLGIEAMSKQKWLGTALGIGGIAWLVWQQTQASGAFSGEANPLLGDALVFGNAFAFSCYNIITKSLMQRYAVMPVLGFTFVQAGVLALLLLLVNQWLQWPSFPTLAPLSQVAGAMPLTAWALLGYMVLIAGFLGYWVHHHSLKRSSANNVAAYSLLQPAIAACLGWVLLHEAFTPLMALAGAVSLVGMVLITTAKPTVPPALGVFAEN